MPARRCAALLLALAATAATTGCTTWNDRFYVAGQDPLLAFMRGEHVTQQGDWPAAQLPYLRPMRTEFIPDRMGPPPDPLVSDVTVRAVGFDKGLDEGCGCAQTPALLPGLALAAAGTRLRRRRKGRVAPA